MKTFEYFETAQLVSPAPLMNPNGSRPTPHQFIDFMSEDMNDMKILSQLRTLVRDEINEEMLKAIKKSHDI